MEQTVKQEIQESVRALRLPGFEEIPSVGLFLDQTSKYISEFLRPLALPELTGSMISNYVKKGLISNPIKKQYSREQIAYLIFIAVSKSVLSLEELQKLIDLQKQTYSEQRAYAYFCRELENVVFYVFGLKDRVDTVGTDETDEKMLLRNTIIAVAHKAYLSKCLRRLNGEEI